MKPLEPLRPQRRSPEPAPPARQATALDEMLEPDLPPIATLPRDHPAWHHDLPLLSERARTLLFAMRPIVVAVLGFWDHAVRRLSLGDRQLSIDVAGSYRLE